MMGNSLLIGLSISEMLLGVNSGPISPRETSKSFLLWVGRYSRNRVKCLGGEQIVRFA